MSASHSFDSSGAPGSFGKPDSSDEPTGPPPWTGPWADDARRLFQVFQTTVEQLAEPVDADQPHPPECRYCPLCRGVALLRQNGPDLLDQVAELAIGLAATLRAATPPPSSSGSTDGDADPDDATEPTDADPSGRASTGTRTGASPRPPSTVRIDVTD